MGERRSRRFGRRAKAAPQPGAATAGAEPCLPCAQQAALRAFSLNVDAAAAITDDVVPDLVDDIAYAIAGGEVVLFDHRRATSTHLNTTAALVWASIDGVTPVGRIIDELAAETGADRATVAADVRETIARFASAGIATTGEASPAPVADDAGDAAAAERDTRRQRWVGAVLARRSWRYEQRRRVAGAAITVRTDSDELAALLAPALDLLPAADEPGTSVVVVDRGGDTARRFRILRDHRTHTFAGTADEAYDALFTLCNDLAIHGSPGRLVLHAGAVARDGSVVVVAGPSGRGKSTLTAALVQRGFAYLTDEVVAIDPTTLDVLPYPKPFDLDRSSADQLGIEANPAAGPEAKAKVAVDAVGRVATEGGRVRLLVLLEDPAGPAAAPTTPAERLIEILTNTFASTFDPASAADQPLAALADLAERVPTLRLERRAVDDACRAIDEQLRSIDLATPSAGRHPADVAT